MIRLLLILLVCITAGCASVDEVPYSIAEVDFSQHEDGMTGWSTYQEDITFTDIDKKLVYMAAKAALAHRNYAIQKADLREGVVVGKHLPDFWHGESVAGIYFYQSAADVHLRIIINGLPVEAERIIKSMRLYIDADQP